MKDDGVVTERVIQMPGVEAGFVGTAGLDNPGPSTRVVAVNPFVYIGAEIGETFLNVFFGLLAVDGLGIKELAPPGDALGHLWSIGGMALAPTIVSLGQELRRYFRKIRASQN